MDFLPRHFAYCALVGALGLVFSFPAFAVAYTSEPLYWSPSSSGSYSIPSLPSNDLQASGSDFSTVDSAVQQSVVTPLLQFAGYNALDLGGSILALRSIPVSSIANSLTNNFASNLSAFQSLLSAPSLASFLSDIFNQYSVSSSPTVEYSSGFTSSSCPAGSVYYAGLYGTSTACTDTIFSIGDAVISPYDVGCAPATRYVCSSSGTYPSPSGIPSGPTPPSNLAQWVATNWGKDNLASDASSVLTNSPSLATAVATDEQDASPFPVAFPNAHPWDYQVPAADASVTGSPTTTTSTNPATGATTTTVSTPTYAVTGGSSVSVSKTVSSVATTCTSSGSCTTAPATTTTSTPTVSSPFVPPTTSLPNPSTGSVTPFPLNLSLPSQSAATCPDPLSYSALGSSFTIPLTPLCNLATDARPYLESLGAVGAGIVIFH